MSIFLKTQLCMSNQAANAVGSTFRPTTSAGSMWLQLAEIQLPRCLIGSKSLTSD